ncbi:calcium-binding and coiled-coil domain-containing protein 2 isoform X1 [Anolis carolinensis]|uniref:calcium-binding and coiled-coil domain-containing protein 2 isoform X1 n=1 Tax=Anolis carolinensis TaxID=28377 RepID=UPI002F2B67BC
MLQCRCSQGSLKAVDQNDGGWTTTVTGKEAWHASRCGTTLPGSLGKAAPPASPGLDFGEAKERERIGFLFRPSRRRLLPVTGKQRLGLSDRQVYGEVFSVPGQGEGEKEGRNSSMEAVPCNNSDEPPTSAVLLDTCHFSQVIFTDVEKFYVPGGDITCHYNLSQQIIPRSKDWVGIFRVGWKTTREYYTFMWAPLPSNANSSDAELQQVLFKAYYLPKDDEYYQFCYVDQDGQVRGASVPFQFRAEAEDDMLVVTTQGEVEEIEQQNTTLLQENQKLKEKQESLREQNEDLQKRISVAEGEVEETMQQNTALLQENQKLKEKQVSLQKQNEDLQKKLKVAEEEKKEFEEKVCLLQTGTMELQRAQDRQALEITSAQTELAAVMENNIKLQKEKEVLEKSLDNLRLHNEKVNGEVSCLKKQVTLLETQSSSTEKELCRVKEERENILIEQEQLEKKLKITLSHMDQLQSKVQSQQKELGDLQRVGQDKSRHLEQLKEESRKLNAALLRQQNLEEELKEKTLLFQTLQNEIDIKEKENQCLRRENEGLMVHLPELIDHPPAGLLTQSAEHSGLLFGNPYSAAPEIPETDLVSVKKCPLCNNVFPDDVEEQEYVDHVQSHLLECSTCHESFDNKQVYDDHVYCHTLDSHLLKH